MFFYCMAEGGISGGRMGRRLTNNNDYQDDDDDQNTAYKSKNLLAERRRRQKLSHRLLELRSLVPIITNMNKATIISDAIAYIMELQKSVGDLGDELLAMESVFEEEIKTQSHQIDAAEEMNKWGIEPEVKVNEIDGSKVWVKIVYEKRRGGFTKVLEAMSVLGFQFTHTTLTSFKGALLLTSCLEGLPGRMLQPEGIREMLLEIIRSI